MLAATIITALFASSMVTALPAELSARQTTICSGTYSNAQCCATDVLGLADLNCANRKSRTRKTQLLSVSSVLNDFLY